MSELDPESAFAAIAANAEPGEKEVVDRLVGAYLRFDQLVHSDGTDHSDGEMVWVYSPQILYDNKFGLRTGLTTRAPNQVAIITPFNPRTHTLIARVPTSNHDELSKTELTDGLVVASQIEELVTRLQAGEMVAVCHPPQ